MFPSYIQLSNAPSRSPENEWYVSKMMSSCLKSHIVLSLQEDSKLIDLGDNKEVPHLRIRSEGCNHSETPLAN